MILAFDIGGTSMKGGRARSLDDIELLERVPTPGRDLRAFLDVLRQAVADCPEPPQALAAAIPGIVERDGGLGVVANVPCLNGIPARATLEAALGLPVVLGNDADCFVLAEAVAGAGRGARVVFGIILGTGVGGGLAIDGTLINAEGGFAGEWGHGPVAARVVGTPPVEIPAFPCGCGLDGCLDATISGPGIEALHLVLGGRAASSREIVAGWEAGEAAAGRTVAAWLEIAAGPLAMLVNVTGADVVPVGGGLGGSTALVAALDAAVRARTLGRQARPLVVPALCREPGLVGAAWLGLAVAGAHENELQDRRQNAKNC